MQIKFIETWKRDLSVSGINNMLLKSIRNLKQEVLDLSSCMPEDKSSELVDFINHINNQQIKLISFEGCFYEIEGINKKLSFENFSSAELLFFIAYCKDYLNQPVIFMDDIKELSNKTLKLFTDWFKESKYINIAFEEWMDIYRFMSVCGKDLIDDTDISRTECLR